jgi:hypothetical protein
MVKPAAGALVIAMIALLAGCVAGQDGGPTRTAKATPETRILIPLTTLVSARLVPAADRSGAPLPASGAAPLTPLIHPAATALFAGDLYIADSGAGRIYRYDRALNVMTVVGGVTASPGMRMAAGADASLYVLDMPQRRVTRFGRGGQVLATYAFSPAGRRAASAVAAHGRAAPRHEHHRHGGFPRRIADIRCAVPLHSRG